MHSTRPMPSLRSLHHCCNVIKYQRLRAPHAKGGCTAGPHSSLALLGAACPPEPAHQRSASMPAGVCYVPNPSRKTHERAVLPLSPPLTHFISPLSCHPSPSHPTPRPECSDSFPVHCCTYRTTATCWFSANRDCSAPRANLTSAPHCTASLTHTLRSFPLLGACFYVAHCMHKFTIGRLS